MDAAASCARGAGRAGSPCEPEASCGRAAPKSGKASWRSRMSCVRQNRVVLAVVATVKSFAEMRASPTGRTASSIRGAREARRKVRLPGEHGISRPTIAQGRPGVFRPTCFSACAFACANSSRSGSRVPAGTRPSLRPLHGRGRKRRAKLGRFMPRECRFMRELRMVLPDGIDGDAEACRSESTGIRNRRLTCLKRSHPRTRCLCAVPTRSHSARGDLQPDGVIR